MYVKQLKFICILKLTSFKITSPLKSSEILLGQFWGLQNFKQWSLSIRTLIIMIWNNEHMLGIVLICVCVRAHPFTCAQSCLTLIVTLWTNPPDSSVHGSFQASIMEWVAISHSKGSCQPRDWTYVSYISCIGRWIFYHCATWEALLF